MSMFKNLMFSPFNLIPCGFSFAEGAGGGGAAGDAGGDKGGAGGEGGGSGDKGDKGADDKAELARIKDENAKILKDLEDLKAEVLTPEYVEFLENKNKGGKGGGNDDKGGDAGKGKDPYEGLTPSQIAAKIREEVRAELDDKDKASRDKEVADFARTHSDFKTYQPIMYGLAIQKDNAHLTLNELYLLAKKHAKDIADGLTTEGDKKRGNKAGGEKPGGSSSGSVKSDGKKMEASEAASEAWDEVVGEAGLPSL